MIENPLIEEFLNYLKNERHCSPHTATCYAADLHQFQAFRLKDEGEQVEMSETSGGFDTSSGEGGTGLAVLASRSVVAPTVRVISSELLVDTSTEDVRRFLAFLQGRGYTEGTAARKLASLRSFFRFCLKRSFVQSSPAALVRSPKQKMRLPRCLKDDELRRLLEAPDISTLLGARDRAMLETMHSSGVRASELVDLNMQDFDSVGELLHIRNKGRKERIAPLSDTALACIQKYLELRKARQQSIASDVDALFVNKFQHRLSTRSIRRKLDKYLAVAGLDPNISPHMLRQSFTTRMLNSGASPRSVQELLGHLSISSTLVYAHSMTN